MEKLKTVREREKERDVEGVEMCHVCIRREKKSCAIKSSCVAAAAVGWKKKKN